MCGIFCSLSARGPLPPDGELASRLQSRGPDSEGTVSVRFPPNTELPSYVHVTLCSTVLSLRGDGTIKQPYRGGHDDYTLCWNGEAWNINGKPPSGCDTEAVHSLLTQALDTLAPRGGSTENVARTLAETLSRIAGPYAFVFVDRRSNMLFFGRDFLGRRSLLKRTTHTGDLIISSISDGKVEDGWMEIEADGIYYIDLDVLSSDHSSSDHSRNGSPRFVTGLVLYLFSDDSTANEIQSVIPRLSLNREKSPSPVYENLNENSQSVATLSVLLRQALSLRVLNIPSPPLSQRLKPQSSGATKLAILFSGGLDCTVLARLSHELLPLSESIDLLNVAFENPRIHKQSNLNSNGAEAAYEQCPDRITGRASYAELQRTCLDRHWRFVVIDVPYSETMEHRNRIISLMHPHNTEMDLSIASALYFAARGEGYISVASDAQSVPYTTPARVLLSGLGADELFAGYTRHATAYKRAGIDGLLDELELDVSRLGKRNLGRDDRVMSHWGKEVRYPYLDESLLKWALRAPVTEKCGFAESAPEMLPHVSGEDGSALEPGKKVLRCLAWNLGMQNVAKEKKRAIQFGARTAKMQTGKTKGTQLLS